MPLIREVIAVTRRPDGRAHITPLGAQEAELPDGSAGILLQPFRPSATHDNLRRWPYATLNHVDDVRIFAGCLTGRRDWPAVLADRIECGRLAAAIAHEELKVERVEDDPVRPRFYCRRVHRAHHAPFAGFNRAQAAVLEASILVSRLGMLAREKVDQEIAYLGIAIEKTAGPGEREAWDWLMAAVTAFRRNQAQ